MADTHPNPADEQRTAEPSSREATSQAIPLTASQATRSWFAATTAFLTVITQHIKGLSITVFAVLCALVTYNEISQPTVLIDPFEVPATLSEQGYTGLAIANKFIDQIHAINRQGKTTMKGQKFAASWMEAPPQIDVPREGLLIQSILQGIKTYLGGETVRIIGEVTRRDNLIYVTTRVSGQAPKTCLSTLNKLDDILLECAEHVYQYTKPYILASYLYDRDKERSKEIIRYILATPPQRDDAWAYNLWGLHLADQKRYQDAIAKYQHAIAISEPGDGASVNAHYNWGLALVWLDKPEEAMAKFQHTIELDHTHAEAYIDLGLILTDQGKHAQAAANYKQAIKIEPNHDRAYFSWGTDLYRQKDDRGAAAKFQQIIDLKPSDVEPFLQWGYALANLGDFDGAIAKYRQAVELEPKTSEAYSLWGQALVEQDDYDQAITRFNQASALAPTDVWANLYWGIALLEKGQPAGASDKFREVLSVDENNLIAQLNLGTALHEQDHHQAALAAYQKVIELNGPDGTYATHATTAIETLYVSQ